MAVLTGDYEDARRTLRSIGEKLEVLATMEPHEIVRYQRDLDVMDTAARGAVRDHRRLARTVEKILEADGG